MVSKKHNQTFTIERRIELPAAGVAARLSIDANGEITFYGHNDEIVTPAKDERVAHSYRAKGPKYHSRVTTNNAYGSFSGLAELARLDSFFVIDTNTNDIQGQKVSVGAFLQLKVISDASGLSCVPCETHAHTFEFRNVLGNAEMLSILMVANANLKNVHGRPDPAIGIITDSELGLHDAINNREHPLYAEKMLPPGFCLIYASADKGQELSNALIKACDSLARRTFHMLTLSDLTDDGFLVVPELPEIAYRYRKSLIEKWRGMPEQTQVKPGTTVNITFHP